MNRLQEKTTQTRLYNSKLKVEEFENRVSQLLSETSSFTANGKRYEGYCSNGYFFLKDTFFTKTKTPPIFCGIYRQTSNQTLTIGIQFYPTIGTFMRGIIGVLLLIIVFVSLSFDHSQLFSFFLALAASSIPFSIVLLNYLDSLKRKRTHLEEVLELQKIQIPFYNTKIK